MSNVHQSFRQGPTGDLVYLEVYDEPEINQPVIYWEDTAADFPGVKHIKNGPAIVSLARNIQRQWCEPRCIRHYPGDVLQVVGVGPSGDEVQSPATLEQSTNHSPSTSSFSAVVPGPAIPDLPAGPVQAMAPAKSLEDMSTDHHFNLDSLALHDATTASASSLVTAVVAATSPTQNRASKRAQTMLFSSSAQLLDFETSARSGVIAKADAVIQGNAAIQQGIQVIQDELRENFPALRSETTKNSALQQELANVQQEMLKLQEYSIRMQQEALDRLALIQNKVAAILTQTYELHEYPIPRLIIVLPKESASRMETLGRGIRNLFADQFTLYFLCECGEHTKPVEGQPTNPSLKHEIHIARHEGYDIDRPNEFFDKYGLYILALLQMLKYGVTIAGVVVPPLGQLNIVDTVESTLGGINTVLQDLGPKVDSSIAYIEGLTGAQSQLVSPDSGSSSMGLGGLEALEGADLRQLESFSRPATRDERSVTCTGLSRRKVMSSGSVSITPERTTEPRRRRISGMLYKALEDNFRDIIKSTNTIEVTIIKKASGTLLSDVFNNGRWSDPLHQMLSGGNLQSYRLFGWDEGFLDCIGTIPTTLTRARLPRALEMVIGEDYYSRASFKVENDSFDYSITSGNVSGTTMAWRASKSTVPRMISLLSNIQDLSKTVIHQDRLSNQHLSASYLGAVQDDWTFTVNMLVLEYHTTTTDITNLAQGASGAAGY
ncbi:MAG: hypothetical protein JOS17DRAFT_842381 [Linnemannia elongata]|nr:MAG: hypothetical protein JOS17DRAFT_842381 [Linnemannia elongata]